MRDFALRRLMLTVSLGGALAFWTSAPQGQLQRWFGSPVHTALPEGARELATGDFNEDGFVDVALVAHSAFGDGWVYVLFGDGSPHFTIDQIYEEPGSPPFRTIDVGHMNDDNHLDIISGNSFDTEIRIRYNDGNGRFEDLQVIQARHPELLRIGDLDGDGFNDIVGLQQGLLWLHWGTSNGPGPIAANFFFELGEPGSEGFCGQVDPVEACIVDLTGDTRNDVLFIATEVNHFPDWCGPDERALGLLRNLGDRQFAQVEWLIREPIEANWKDWKDLAVVDLDHDDDQDVVISRLAYLRTFLNDGAGILSEDTGFGSPGAGEVIAVDDFNGDDTLDIAWSWTDVDADIFRGIGDNEYSYLESLGEPLLGVETVAIDDHPGPELIGFNGGGLTVIPNISYLEPASVAGEESVASHALRVDPSVIGAGVATVSYSSDQDDGAPPQVDVVDVTGRIRTTLHLRTVGRREYSTHWSGTDDRGERLPAGVYWIRARDAENAVTRVAIVN